MAFYNRIKEVVCFCGCKNEEITLTQKKFKEEHQYCGCLESENYKAPITTPSDVDTVSLVDNEVFEAVDEELQIDENTDILYEEAITSFNRVLHSPLQPQSDILVHGTLRENAISFAINFVVACDSKEDVAFHFNPRLDQYYSAQNSRLKGKWGKEEIVSLTKFPFQRGKPFVIEIFLTHNAFLVAVNGIHYCSYRYRTHLKNISSLQVCGDVRLASVKVTDNDEYPSHSIPSLHIFPLMVAGVTECEVQRTPVYGVLSRKLGEKCKIEINGSVQLFPISFYINLQEGARLWPHPEVPLQVLVRFNINGVHQIVFINSYHEDTWNKEVQKLQPEKFLFIPGCAFKVTIECGSNAFDIRVGEKTISTFEYMVPYTLVDTIRIHGDVFIYDINLS